MAQSEPATVERGKWRALNMHERGGVVKWMVEDNVYRIQSNAHCLCCAYVDALNQHGGDVDLRGLHGYGPCYQFLAVTVRGIREDTDSTLDDQSKATGKY